MNTSKSHVKKVIDYSTAYLLALTWACLSSCSVGNLHEVSCQNRTTPKSGHRLDKSKGCEDRSWLPYISCGYHFLDCSRYQPEWNNDSPSVATARNVFKYAMMANNTYLHDADTEFYQISGWKKISRMESDSGLALDVYSREAGGMTAELAVAYEGTNRKSFNDWKFNLALLCPHQQKEALSHMKALKGKYPGTPITAVGHSLGGGIALNMSMHVEGVNAVAFNSSPRAFWGRENQSNANTRTYVYESGEILTSPTRAYMGMRLYGKQMTPVRFNFLNFNKLRGGPVSEHSMYYLSRGILLVAIKGGSHEAAKSFVENFKLHDGCERCQHIKRLAEKSN